MRSRPVAGEVIPTPRGSDAVSLYTWASAICTVLTRRFAQGDRDLTSTSGTKAGVTQTATDLGHWLIEEPKDKTYTVAQKVARACTITEVTTRCTAGTATVTIKINGTSLGGTANSASTTEQSQSHSSANEVAAGDTVTIVVSSTSGAEMISVSIAGTVTLDP
jgi:hypothetical protein